MSVGGPFRALRGIPSIKRLMTPFPYSIPSRASLAEARRMMAEHDIRHLPVKDGERLVGVVSDRDLEVASPPDGARVVEQSVGGIAGPAYVVDLSTPADQVLEAMAARHLGAALVVKDDRLAGIFTVTDACSRFRELLLTLFPRSGDGEVA